MSNDGLKQDLIATDFKAGEQPDHIKLTAVVSQLKTAVETAGIAIGDVHSGQTHTGTQGGGHTFDLGSLPNATPNLSRLVGSSGFANPRHFSRTERTLEITFAASQSIGGDPATFDGFNHWNRREFKLPYPPIILTSTEGAEDVTLTFSYALGASYWAIGSPGAGYTDASAKATTRVSNLDDLVSTGQYYVHSDGTIILYDELADGTSPDEAFKVTYKFHVIPDRYDGASLNVIPDFSQTGTLCTVAWVSGTTFNITLPTVTARRAASLATWIPPDEIFSFDKYLLSGSLSILDPMYGVRAQLPTIFRQNFSASDVIPEGAIYLWDEEARGGLGEIVSGITFSYLTASSVQAAGIALEVGSDRYRLLVPGCDIAQTLSTLSESYYWHDHSGRYIPGEGLNMGQRIRHCHLLNLIDEGGKIATANDAHGYRVSTLGPTRNPHPMYLHRDGYRYKDKLSDGSTTEPNFNNALMGDLVIGNTSNIIDLSQDSYSIYFGSVLGSRLKYDKSALGLAIDGGNVVISDGGLSVHTGGIYSGPTGGSSIGLKWADFGSSDIGATGTHNITFTTPSDCDFILGITCTCVNWLGGSPWTYFTPISATEAAANQELGIAYATVVTATGNTTITIKFGSALNNLMCYGLVFYIGS